MKNIKVSVIIRTFNESKWISLCVKKLVEQSIKPSEIILIDNNSFDGTKRVAKSISKKLKVQKILIPQYWVLIFFLLKYPKHFVA